MSRFLAVSPFVCLASIATLNLPFARIARSQPQPPIAPAADGTGTLVTPNGQRFDIDGGTRSLDGANLFHSFDRFSVGDGQSANFLSSPEIQNILGRVVGGDPSIVNGAIEVTGGISNLLLMNPAGIVFGADARLNVPASFAATTATGIGFEGGWFDATGSGSWGDLAGDPSAFRFDRLQPGRLVNFGDLEVPKGETLSLLGGVVVNAGSAIAPEGSVNAIAVEGGNLLRLSAAGHLLSLEIEATDATAVPSLAELLTRNPIDRANQQLTVSETGEVTLSGSVLPEVGGDAIATGTIDVSGDRGGTVNLLGNRVALLGAIDASGTFGGGRVLVGGDVRGGGPIPTAAFAFVGAEGAIDVSALEFGDGGTAIVYAEDATQFLGTIRARGGAFGGDGGFIEVSGAENLSFRGAADTLAPQGRVGMLLLDPDNITIVAAPGPNPPAAADGIWAFAEDPGSQTIGVDAILTLLGTGDLTLEATNDITWGSGVVLNYDGIGTGRTLTLTANNDIAFAGQIQDLTVGGDSLSVTLNAGGGVDIPSGAIVETHGGNFIATGASGLAGSEVGILVGGTIDAGGGNLSLHGTSAAITGMNRDGIQLNASAVLQTQGAGTIALVGTGGGGTVSESNGIAVAGAMVRSQNDISLVGTGSGSNGGNDGIDLSGVVEATGVASMVSLVGTNNSTGDTANRGINIFGPTTMVRSGGTIALTGTGGNGTNDNPGISVSGSTVQAAGDITAIGNGGNGSSDNNTGILVGGTFDSTGGAIELTGMGGSGGIMDSDGITISSVGSITANGDITLHGTGGNGSDRFHDGIAIIDNGTIESTGGAIALVGTGGSGSDENDGVILASNSFVTLRAAGDITLTGTGGNEGRGVVLDDTIESSGGGAISISGTQGTGGPGTYQPAGGVVRTGGDITLEGASLDSAGIDLRGRIESTGTSATVALTGTSNGTAGNNNRGINIEGATAEILSGGAIALTGAGGNGVSDNNGIRIFNSNPIAAAGAIALVGTGNGTSDSNQGILIENSEVVSTGSGAISLTGEGTSVGDKGTGIDLDTDSQVRTEGNIFLIGTGNGPGSDHSGIRVVGIVESTGTTSTVAATGTSNGTGGDRNRGIDIDGTMARILSVGEIELMGAAGSGTSDNQGIGISNSAQISAGGAIALVGTGNSTGATNQGIAIDSGTIESTGTGSIELTAFVPSGESAFQLDGTFNSQSIGINVASGDLIETDPLTTSGSNLAIANSAGNIVLGAIDTSAAAGGGGNVTLTASNGSITTDSIDTQGGNGSGGNVTLTTSNGNITTASINAQSIGGGGSGGNVSFTASGGNITTAAIDARSSGGGSGGNVNLNASVDTIADSVNTESTNGPGGNITIAAGQFVRLTSSFTALDGVGASASTQGTPSGNSGNISIQHGGNGITPFEISLSPAPPSLTNGTSDRLTRGAGSEIDNASFLFTHTQDGGAIGIISVPAPVTIPPAPPEEVETEVPPETIVETLPDILVGAGTASTPMPGGLAPLPIPIGEPATLPESAIAGGVDRAELDPLPDPPFLDFTSPEPPAFDLPETPDALPADEPIAPPDAPTGEIAVPSGANDLPANDLPANAPVPATVSETPILTFGQSPVGTDLQGTGSIGVVEIVSTPESIRIESRASTEVASPTMTAVAENRDASLQVDPAIARGNIRNLLDTGNVEEAVVRIDRLFTDLARVHVKPPYPNSFHGNPTVSGCVAGNVGTDGQNVGDRVCGGAAGTARLDFCRARQRSRLSLGSRSGRSPPVNDFCLPRRHARRPSPPH